MPFCSGEENNIHIIQQALFRRICWMVINNTQVEQKCPIHQMLFCLQNVQKNLANCTHSWVRIIIMHVWQFKRFDLNFKPFLFPIFLFFSWIFSNLFCQKRVITQGHLHMRHNAVKSVTFIHKGYQPLWQNYMHQTSAKRRKKFPCI